MGTLECSQLVRARGRARHHAPPPTSPGDSQTPERSPGDHPQVSPGPPDVLRVPLQSPGEICGGVPRRSGGSPGEIWGEPQGDLWGELQGNLGAAPRRYGGALRISGGPSDPQASSIDLLGASPRSARGSLPRSPPARSHLIPQARLGSLTSGLAHLLPSLAPASCMKTANSLSSGPSYLLVPGPETASLPAHRLLQVPFCPGVTTRAGPDLV